MNYTEELRDLLRPLKLYDVDAGLGGAELAAEGAALNGIYAMLEKAETELSPATAEDYGLKHWEALLPFIPAYRTAADRRRAISALLRIDGASFTPDAINNTIAGCGMRAVVTESETDPMTVIVSFPYTRGEPDELEDLRVRIEQIIPCHLDVEYVFLYVSWRELVELFATWAEIEAAAGSWRELERMTIEDE